MVNSEQRRLRYERPIGSFCGAVLGFCLTGLLAFLFDAGVSVSITAIITGTIAGTVLGYKHPSISYGVYVLIDLIAGF